MSAMLLSVRRLVEPLAPAPICDACIAGRLEIDLTDDLRATLGELAVERGFDRGRDHCSLCDQPGAVLRQRRNAA